MIEKYLIALQSLLCGEAKYFQAGDITMRLICPGLVFMRVEDHYYLVRDRKVHNLAVP